MDAPPQDGSTRAGPLFRLDPGWLFLVSGIVLVSSAVLIPAQGDLRLAEWNRDRAWAVEITAKQRLANHAEYLDALRREDRTLAVSLAATHLNLAPADRQPMIDASQAGLPSADAFAALEPPRAAYPPPPAPASRLHRWSANPRTRPWLLAGGMLLILVGLLPPAKPRTVAA